MIGGWGGVGRGGRCHGRHSAGVGSSTVGSDSYKQAACRFVACSLELAACSLGRAALWSEGWQCCQSQSVLQSSRGCCRQAKSRQDTSRQVRQVKAKSSRRGGNLRHLDDGARSRSPGLEAVGQKTLHIKRRGCKRVPVVRGHKPTAHSLQWRHRREKEKQEEKKARKKKESRKKAGKERAKTLCECLPFALDRSLLLAFCLLVALPVSLGKGSSSEGDTLHSRY